MSQCIYCSAEADSEEDWLPLWMGNYRGVSVLRDRLCDRCNRALGKDVDQVMSRATAEAVNRQVLGIQGRHDQPIADPFLFWAQTGAPLRLHATKPQLGFNPALTPVAPGMVRWLRQIVLQKDDRPAEAIPLQQAMLNDGFPRDWLRKAVAERGLEGARVLAIVWDTPKQNGDPMLPEPLAMQILDALPNFEADAKEHGVPMYGLDDHGEQVNEAAQLELRLRVEYARGLAKIAFHYLLFFDNGIDGHETEFAPVKSFIRSGHGDPSEFVDLRNETFVIGDGAFADRPNSHYLLSEPGDDGMLRVRLWFFSKGPFLDSPRVQVTLGKDPCVRYPSRGHAITIWTPPMDGADGEIFEMPATRFGGKWALVDLR